MPRNTRAKRTNDEDEFTYKPMAERGRTQKQSQPTRHMTARKTVQTNQAKGSGQTRTQARLDTVLHNENGFPGEEAKQYGPEDIPKEELEKWTPKKLKKEIGKFDKLAKGHFERCHILYERLHLPYQSLYTKVTNVSKGLYEARRNAYKKVATEFGKINKTNKEEIWEKRKAETANMTAWELHELEDDINTAARKLEGPFFLSDLPHQHEGERNIHNTIHWIHEAKYVLSMAILAHAEKKTEKSDELHEFISENKSGLLNKSKAHQLAVKLSVLRKSKAP
jgi:hypothetical protein